MNDQNPKPADVKIIQAFERTGMNTPLGLGDDNLLYYYDASERCWYLWA